MKKMFLAVCCGMMLTNLQAQDWLGRITERHAGVNALHVQPAGILNSPYKWDVAIIGADAKAVNMDVFSAIDDPLDFIEGDADFALELTGQLPSFLYKINDKNAIAFEAKVRGMFFTQSSNSELLDLLAEDFDVPEDFGREYQGEFINGRTNIWWEFGATYARNVWQNSDHRIDAGGTFKVVFGTGGGFVNVESLDFTLDDQNIISDVGGRMEFIYSQSIDDLYEGESITFLANPGVAGSIGIDYYWSPRGDDYTLRAGLAVTDIGNIKYDRAPSSSSYVADVQQVNVNSFRNVASLDDLNQAFGDVFAAEEDLPDQFKVSLPTKLNLMLDYRIIKNVYANFSTYFFIPSTNLALDKNSSFHNYVLTPRYEKRKWGVHVPFIYSKASGFRPGLGFRIGPFYAGSSNLFRAIANRDNVQEANVYLGFRFGRLWNR